MRFIDIFAGIGGFRKGLEANGHECVFSCEIDKNARKSYMAVFNESNAGEKENVLDELNPDLVKEEQRNFNVDEVAITSECEVIYEDVTKFNNMTVDEIKSIIPHYDIFCGGFPCQPFSRAGRRDGFKDENKGTLFFSIINIVEATKPSIVFLENVKGLLTVGEKIETKNKDGNKLFKEVDKGSSFRDILREFHRVGYDVEWQLINSADFISHKRERVYIIARKRRDNFFKRIFPIHEQDLNQINIDTFIKNPEKALSDFEPKLKSKTSIRRFDISEEEMVDLDTKEIFKFNKVSPFSNWGVMINGVCTTAQLDSSKYATQQHKLIDILNESNLSDEELKKYMLSKDEEEKQRYAKSPKEWKSGNKMGRMAFPDRIDKPSRTLTANSSGREMMVIGFYIDNNTIKYINEIVEENDNEAIVINEEYEEVKISRDNLLFRKLTPLEYWKLQGFEEKDFNKAKIAGVPDGQLKKQAGNAVTCKVIEKIGQRL